MMPSDEDPFAGAPLIFSYSRKQALEDGVLVDLSEYARELGFTIPVACTSAVWHGCVVPPDGTRELGQSERGRGHDLLWMLLLAIGRAGKDSGGQLIYQAAFLNSKHLLEAAQLKAVCGPGDDGQPVLTLMYPDED